jgi:hypothetical protein
MTLTKRTMIALVFGIAGSSLAAIAPASAHEHHKQWFFNHCFGDYCGDYSPYMHWYSPQCYWTPYGWQCYAK